MNVPKKKLRLAVVSPFLDKSHGTERIAVEWIAQIAGEFDVHIYSQHVEDLDLSTVTWHRIPKLPGPHIVNFLWWFGANHIWRAWDRRAKNLEYDVVYSPGVNCFDADAVSVHIVYAEFLRRVRPELAFTRNPLRAWPLLLHRRLYYRLVMALEKRVFQRPETQLILTSRRSAEELARFYGRHERLPLIETGLDHKAFNPEMRLASRAGARQAIGLRDETFTLLLIGNDWRKKGLRTLLEALTQLTDLGIHLVVVTNEAAAVSQAVAQYRELREKVHILPPRKDVEFYYAAADAYVGPSLEDTFALPAAEAMACGLPVIISARAGAADICHDGVDALVLSDPKDTRALATMIRRLCADEPFRAHLGVEAAKTARQYTWEGNGRELMAIFEEILLRKRKSRLEGRTSTQERVSVARKKIRLAVVSPFLDKRHGTERRVVEWITHLRDRFEVHVYSQAIDDLDLSEIQWHRIPKVPGPHILNFLWWFAANHLWRVWGRYLRGLRHDIVLTPGPNCFDADVVSVHIVFAEFLRRVSPELKLMRNPMRFWFRLLHRRLYYQLVVMLERHVYSDPRPILVYIARKTAADVERFYGQRDQSPVLYAGIDREVFNPERRLSLRKTSKNALELSDDRFVLLLVGNDLHKKGIRALLDAMALLGDRPIDLLVVGSEDPRPFRAMAFDRSVGERVHFLPPREDIEFYYAAADVYVGPSLEDAYAQPPAEAMACGVAVIVSSAAGVSEIVTSGVDGLILDDPTDAASLAAMICRLYEDREFGEHLGRKAAETARQFTWERNGRELAAIFEEVLRRKARSREQTQPQEL
jgi:glycosyltransferase involved in cell wall biosynthesis